MSWFRPAIPNKFIAVIKSASPPNTFLNPFEKMFSTFGKRAVRKLSASVKKTNTRSDESSTEMSVEILKSCGSIEVT